MDAIKLRESFCLSLLRASSFWSSISVNDINLSLLSSVSMGLAYFLAVDVDMVPTLSKSYDCTSLLSKSRFIWFLFILRECNDWSISFVSSYRILSVCIGKSSFDFLILCFCLEIAVFEVVLPLFVLLLLCHLSQDQQLF